MMGQEHNDECTRPMCAHHDASKHGCGHLDSVKRTWIHLKNGRLAIRVSGFVVDLTIQDTPVYDATSKIIAAMVSELRVHAAAKVVELLVQT
ncbi:hypothetical protein TNCV_4796401 [Trichonephila clavipes]|uniref:Uncharacterized protein n=1 Tax=Trichonephila clavipes TaxID=2585209 RepID=A0A8X6RZ91_TRICX|nr:hypothetical protein TNCV_4796401 [Trichonephila clavipes]